MAAKARKRKPRVAIDTSVLVGGVSGFREPFVPEQNPSSDMLHNWTEQNNFIWRVTEDILDEYKEVRKRLGVRPNGIGTPKKLIRERAEMVRVRISAENSPDPDEDAFCVCAESGNAHFKATLNRKDFPQDGLESKIVLPAEFRK